MTSREIGNLSALLRVPGPHPGGQFIARARRGPHPAVHQCRMVQFKKVFLGEDPGPTPGPPVPRSASGPAASTTTWKMLVHRPDHTFFEMWELLLRRLFQGRRHRDGLGTPDAALQAPGG